jgi:hypothetical protein
LSWLTLFSSHQYKLWNLFVPEEEGSRNSCLGGGEFELLVEIVNPIPAKDEERGDRRGGLPKNRPEAR